jgi:subtilisin family serine protease
VLAESNWYPFWNRDDARALHVSSRISCEGYWPKEMRRCTKPSRWHGHSMPKLLLGPCQPRWRPYYRTETDYATLPALEGTSFAAPIVASAIACLLEANPSLTPLLIRDVLRETAFPNNRRQLTGAALRET